MRLFCILLAWSWCIGSQAAPLKPGDAFPDLRTFELEGELPADLKGKILIIDFWASWCGPCREAFAHLDRIQKEFAKRGVLIIGISVDKNAADMKRFLAHHPVSFAVARDAAHRLVAACDIPAMPTSFVVDRTGVIHAIHQGFVAGETDLRLTRELEELVK